MQSRYEEIRAVGGDVVAIGMGTGVEAAAAAEKFGVTYRLLGDPEHRGYGAFDLERAGVWNLLVQPFIDDPIGGVKNLVKADLRASASPRSDVSRLSGVAVVDRDGVIRWLHRAATTTDLPETDVLIDALRDIAN